MVGWSRATMSPSPPARCPAVFVVDIDGMDAEGELRKLEREHGDLPATVEAITARGRHLYFQNAGIAGA